MGYWLLAVMLIATTCLAGTTTVHDLGAVNRSIAQAEGKRSFADQIEGDTPTAALGTILPDGLDRRAIVGLVAPHADPSLIMLVGARKWAHLADGYVAIVCVAHDGEAKKLAGDGPSCADHPEVFLGVLKLPAGGAATLVARTGEGFALTSDWPPRGSAPIRIPSVAPASTDAGTGEPSVEPDDEVAGFDLAPYLIAPGVYAFGLRGDREEGYSGGYGTFETLHLFAVAGSELRRILVQPIFGFRMTAGEWHKDGTRDHTVSEAKLVLAAAPTLTAGHFDLIVKQRGQKTRSVLRWNAAKGVYWVPDD